MTSRVRLLAGAMAVTAGLGTLVGAMLETGFPVPLSQWFFVAIGLPLPVLGRLIAVRRPTNPYGWLLLGAALCFGLGGLGVGALLHHVRTGQDVPGPGVAAAALFGVHYGLVWIFVPLLFPDGRLPSPRWRPLAWAGTACIALHTFGVLFAPGLVDEDVPVANPLALPGVAGSLAAAAATVGSLLMPVAAAGALGALITRWRGAAPSERRQLRWMTAGFLLNGTGFLLALGIDHRLVAPDLSGLVVLSVLGAVPAAIGVAVVRYNLLDIRLVIRGSLAYGLLWSAIALVYAGVATGLGVVAGERLPVAITVVLTVLVTLVFQPVRARLEALADRLVFGVRPTAAHVLVQMSAALDAMSEPGSQLRHLAHVARSALGTQWIAVRLEDGTEANAGAVTSPPERTVAITSEGRVVGRLSCGPKIEGRLTDRDHTLLTALAAQAGLALRATRLAARLVHAQETERRRIERNIHDGVQQQLVALIAGLELARTAPRAETLAQLRAQARATLEDLRELAAGIHPTVLTQGGLVEAVEERCDRLPVDVGLTVDDELRGRRFCDDVEGAAYFTVGEALANALKHAAASRIEIRLGLRDGDLLLEVADDGKGFDPAAATRRGLGPLADRLSALGGNLETISAPGEGTRVNAWIPVDG
ncbi:sensor histidine kinase [Nonomuraea jabiensis]|uniref:Signal transduction histidine kinase n=1 Tax=Nonomuraea jabiensis TaxID=882448 RepID=A0A7W9FY82_9ACTN|nr:ATP-binding protein [Nonomuraea jabiensis]MBB5773752.1 signal transduction histidine kinase [Nonomuraea jabiensis]